MSGQAEPRGVTLAGDGINVAVHSAHAEAIEVCLFENNRETRRIRLDARTGDVFHAHIPGIAPGATYGLRAHGRFAPHEGHRFNPSKLLLDPYATAIDRPFALHPSMFGYRTDAPDDGNSFDDTDSGPYMPKAIVQAAPATFTAAQITPWPRSVLYELHVRGFTARHPAIPIPLRGRFAGLAHPAAIEHLVRLGITAVEIMPAAAWIAERHLAARGLPNYWGYNPVAFMAPDPGLAPGGWPEIRATVAALAEAGIETILDVVLNHTGEGDALGPTLSLRGLDNATYYRLPEDAPGRYIDDAGCGNILALDRPPVLRLAMDAMRAWAANTGLHGFRFDLATTLARRPTGFDPAAPLLQAIDQDPLLRGLKLIAEPWDIGPGGYQTGRFPAAWGEWNDRFRDDVRRFWRGEPGRLGPLATRLAGSADLFAARPPSRGINFITAHDGFTLADLTAFTTKHNQANAENNRDGTDANHSWNHGTEGPDPALTPRRQADQRALLATLLLARGTPMLAMGMELGHTQHGNNNAYAQDNETTWLDWAAADPALAAWTARLIALRRDHPLFHADRFLDGHPIPPDDLPDVAWSGPDGATPDWSTGETLVMTLADGPNRVALIHHRGAHEATTHLPPARTAHRWHLVADSAAPDAPTRDLPANTTNPAPRSVQALAERPITARPPADPTLLRRLATAAGIGPDWWTVDGAQTIVNDDTNRALLAAMRLPATTAAEARDTLRHLAETRDHRPLPHALVTRGEPAILPLALPPGLGRTPRWLTIALESGETITHRAEPGTLRPFTAADGTPAQAWDIPLPALPIGRHRIWRDDAPDAPCALTIAPRACHRPAALTHGQRRFGLAAQLYTLRRAGDQGIGDFTTLALLAEAAAQAGAATVAINPLHMLFPDDRERASPYHPSDRRFLDPIYLDVAGLPPALPHDDVAYPTVWAAKRAILERDFLTETANPALDAFIAAGGPRLHRFATFQAIAETLPATAWQHWPAPLRHPDHPGVEAFAQIHAARLRFHQYLQFRCETQFATAATRAAALPIGLYRDLAVGAAPIGAEAWAEADRLAHGAWVGAPPDPFAPQGQNWHLPPPLPLAMPHDGYASFAALLAANMRHAGALRIDHVMGLARLFWIPDGGTGADGAYVRYPTADLLGQITLESTRARCMVVGEDLGTVPDGLRPALLDADILGMRVLLLERDGPAFRPAATYPARAVACVSTHDLPPLAGWLEGADIAERVTLGLLPPETDRTADRIALTEAIGPTTPREAAHRFIAETPCDLALIQADDLVPMTTSVNLPGTDTERPNWRRRLPTPVETLLTGDIAQAILKAVQNQRSQDK